MDKKNIAKNTVFLYARMCVMLLVSLISSRLLLKNLGVVDYGVYNVVYGLVLFFNFMNGTLTSGTQRFLNYAMGKNEEQGLLNTFKAAYTNHLLLAAIILFIILIAGNLMVGFILDIPSDRIGQSYLLFNLTALSLFFTIITVPYQADIIAHEDMNIYALFSIVDSVLKLVVASALYFFADSTRISFYGLGLLAISIIVFVLYKAYSGKHYKECVSKAYWDKSLNWEMLKFSGWDTLGWGASACAGQGVNILLNVFGGPLLNASRGVSVQVYSLLNQLVNSFQNAINPQIVKTYAQGRTDETYTLLSLSSKFSLLLVSLVAIPMFIDMGLVLHFWLGEVPNLSLEFSRIMVLQSLIIGFTRPIVNSVHATGNIKWPCIYSGLALFVIVPISWVLLSIGTHPIFVLTINVIPWIVEGFINLRYLKKYLNMDYVKYLINVLIRPLAVILISYACCDCLDKYMPNSFIGLVVLTLINGLLVTILTYIIALSKTEQSSIMNIVKRKIHK